MFDPVINIRILREGSQMRDQAPITSTLFKNATMLDIFAVANVQTSDSPAASYFIYIQGVLNAILLSHFILDLRSIYLTDSNPSQTSHSHTTLQFVANIQGNIGASLNDSWATGEEGDLEEDEEIQYSDNPLATGLLGTKRSEVEEIEIIVENMPIASDTGNTVELTEFV
ncbi:hypothetical protein QCA50_010639 [Cerrena zonata]|uniref:Uncharacterized protein n=1 Tax=Cerrena zonata TaxID=2478898 RepID=A0AAW0FYZ6_9APHY